MKDNKELMDEFVYSVYDTYDTIILNFPIAAGININLLNVINDISLKEKQETIFLLRNSMLMDQMFNDYCFMVGVKDIQTRINTYYEYDNGSTVFFKIYNKIEHPLIKKADNIIFYNIDMYKNNTVQLELIEKIKNYNKKLFINCNYKYHTKGFIQRKLKGNQCSYEMNNYDDFFSLIRQYKIKKIKDKIS